MYLLYLFLPVACWYDYRYRRIPNRLIYCIFIWGICFRLWCEGPPGIVWFAIQISCMILLLYPFFKINSIGAGDVKLLALTAGFIPWQKNSWFLLITLTLSALISILKMIHEGYFLERLYYLAGYVTDVLRTGKAGLYLDKGQDKRQISICLSGPILMGWLLYMGGVY